MSELTPDNRADDRADDQVVPTKSADHADPPDLSDHTNQLVSVAPPEQDAPVLTWKRAQNMQVVGLAQGAFAGRLDDFQFDLETHAVYGWRVKTTGMWGRTGAVAASKLSLIGRDVALIESVDHVSWGSSDRKAVSGRAWASSYRGTQAITRRGRALGAVQDYVIDAQGRRVTGILLHGDRLLPLDGRVNSGPAAVIAADDQVVVELGSSDEDPEGVRWWQRLRKALGVGDDTPSTSSSSSGAATDRGQWPGEG